MITNNSHIETIIVEKHKIFNLLGEGSKRKNVENLGLYLGIYYNKNAFNPSNLLHIVKFSQFQYLI